MDTSLSEETPEHDAPAFVDARFAGGAISLATERSDWLGETLARVEFPGHVLHLREHEARDLAAALQAVAARVADAEGQANG